MRQIGNLPDREQAQAFADYLLTLGITTRLDQSHDGVVIWIRDEDHIGQARRELDGFRSNPSDARYVAAAQHASQLRREEQRKADAYRRNLIDMRRRWSTAGGPAERPLTVLLIMAAVAATLLSNWGRFNNPITRQLSIERVSIDPLDRVYVQTGLKAVREGEVWRLFTPVLLHGSVLHLLFNMLLLYDLGGMIESRRGPVTFFLLVVVTALVSNLGQYYWEGPNFLGMSGVDYGLFGYIWMKSRFDPTSGLFVHPNTVFMLLAWFVVCFFPGMRIANGAHAAGLIAGVVIGYAPIAWRKLSRS